jgi:hemoglobin-like flavoprotein
MPVHRHPVALSKAADPLAIVPLDLALVQRLRATYDRVRAHDLRLAELFYTKLFTAAPHLRSMFGSDLRSQAVKLTAALAAVVENFENPAANAALLADLGRRHATYGATPEHYDLVINLLIDSMQTLLGHDTTRRDLDEWRLALRLVSDQMISAAAAPRP